MILETDKIDPARDVVGGGGAEGTLAASGDKEAVCAAIERAGAEAAAGRSPYARPRVELAGPPDVALVNEAGGPQVNGPATVRLRVSGFSEGMTPRVFWRREGFATDGGRGSTHWMELPGAALATNGGEATGPDGTPLPGVSALTAALDLSSPGPDGTIAQAGHTVQLLLVDAVTAQSAGASFTIGAN